MNQKTDLLFVSTVGRLLGSEKTKPQIKMINKRDGGTTEVLEFMLGVDRLDGMKNDRGKPNIDFVKVTYWKEGKKDLFEKLESNATFFVTGSLKIEDGEYGMRRTITLYKPEDLVLVKPPYTGAFQQRSVRDVPEPKESTYTPPSLDDIPF